MAKRIKERVADSFGENDEERMLRYMDWLRSAILDYIQSMRKLAVTFLLLIVAFELVADSRSVSLSIGSFRITRDSIVLVFLPAIVSFLYLQIGLDTQKAGRMQVVFDEMFKIWSAKAARNGLNSLIYGAQPAYWNTVSPAWSHHAADQLDARELVLKRIITFIIPAGTLIFEGHAYYVLFPVRASEFIAWAISLGLSLFCLFFGISFLYADVE